MEATALHRVVRQSLATLLLECAEAGGLPRFVEKDFERYPNSPQLELSA